MASMIPHLLLYSVLPLLLSQSTHSAHPFPQPKNIAALKPQPSSTYIVHVHHLAKPSIFATLDHWYTSMVASHSPRAGADDSTRLVYTYDTVMHGFAVQLTADEARRMASATGVNAVHEDRHLILLTTRTPGFLGLDPDFGAWRDTDMGDGVIIGFIDSGIWPESPSFSDVGLRPVRSSWRGKCVGPRDFNASLCNNKLVGAKSFVESDGSPSSPRDTFGHGTHVASTAAGSEVRDTGFAMFAEGTARGVAPKARVAMYQVSPLSSNTAGTVAAIDTAVKDGVDIISVSLGYPRAPFYNDPLAIAVFGAEKKGVFVVLAGGNGGPSASTVINAAPWMTTVGAATVDRLLPVRLRLGDGTELTGQSLYGIKANGTNMVPLLNACSAKNLTPDQIMGKIVVCVDSDEDDHFGDEDLFDALQHAGAAGLVQVDPEEDCSSREVRLPSVVISNITALKLRAYMKSAPSPVASFSFAGEPAIGEIRAPIVARFSSRGPNPIVPELLKPDVIAPGVNILAAWTGITPTNARRNNKYKLDSGTSMSCPHVAGVAALIRKKHPSWTPAMIRSALITTAGTLDNTDREILDNALLTAGGGAAVATPFATGAGHVRPQLAMDPGLVYNAGARDYVDFLCALNYTEEQIHLFMPDFVNCTKALTGGPAGLNYASFVVVFDKHTDVRALTRTVTKVSKEAESYSVNIVAPEHVKVIVTPTTLEFKKAKETKSYTVEFSNEDAGNREAGEWDLGRSAGRTRSIRSGSLWRSCGRTDDIQQDWSRS